MVSLHLSMEILPSNYLLLLLPLLILPLYFLKTRKFDDDRNKPNYPLGPPKLPIIGNLHQLGKPPHQALSKLSKIYGPVILLQFGSVPTLVISSAEAAKQVLKTLDLEFCTRPPLTGTKRLSYNHLDISFVPYGEYWKEVRKICVLELLSIKRVQSFKADRAEEIDVLIDSLSFSSNICRPVDIFEMLTSFTHKTICRVAFGSATGQSRNLFNGRLTEILFEAMSVLSGFYASDFFPKVGWVIDRTTGIHGRTEKVFHDLDELFQQMIQEHLNPERPKPEHEDLIDVLVILESDPTSSTVHLANDNIKAILMNIFLAGVDSSAVAANWAMTELAKNPEAMKKVQEEIRSHVGSKGKVEESDLDNLHFLKMLVKETFRLHPGNALLVRECMKHSKIDGFDVYPKTTVLINAWAIGRDPKYWQNPEKFFPERFKDSSIDFSGSQNFEYLPFGGGRRGCPGMSMAMVLIELVLANLLYAFDWKLPKGLNKEDLNMEESPGLTIHKKYPLELVPIKYIYDADKLN